MTLTFDTIRRPTSPKQHIVLDAPFLAASTLTFLKPRLKGLIRPLAAKLAGVGVTANQVTLASLAGSIGIGSLLYANPGATTLFILLPLWLPIRTACASLDGTLAVDFGQKSRLGGILNEAGDIASDVALFLPLAFIAPFSAASIAFLISLIVFAEIAGIIGPALGSDRRLEGPLGKADRSIILAALGLAIAVFDGLPESAHILLPLLYGALILTIWNRLRFALADEGRAKV
ncbi:MAG: CDP-alcohol phosphatidyltransferase [Agrobacterium fabrum]|uniref:CDP-alcohol phosphatidyltransferase n=1 Tax=Agrobacterium fabrum TaxID=1176649 RepID=A0A2W5FIC3_9HYPH|nr:MAG: CDP-alcohol phosphatidyltransferase [Agrobacterium fabrum]